MSVVPESAETEHKAIPALWHMPGTADCSDTDGTVPFPTGQQAAASSMQAVGSTQAQLRISTSVSETAMRKIGLAAMMTQTASVRLCRPAKPKSNVLWTMWVKDARLAVCTGMQRLQHH